MRSGFTPAERSRRAGSLTCGSADDPKSWRAWNDSKCCRCILDPAQEALKNTNRIPESAFVRTCVGVRIDSRDLTLSTLEEPYCPVVKKSLSIRTRLLATHGRAMPCEVVVTRFRTTQPMRVSFPCSYQIYGSLQATSSCDLYDKMLEELASEA
jgi:hypothetical protein